MYVVLTVTGFEQSNRGYDGLRESAATWGLRHCAPRSSLSPLSHSPQAHNRPITDPTPLVYSGSIYTTYSADTQRGIKLAITPLP